MAEAKEVSINKTNVKPFCMYSVEHNREAMRTLTKPGYYLYTYFLQNQDGYNFILRQSYVSSVTGLSQSSYFRALKELIDKGYIIDCPDGYEFHESPQTT